MRSVKALALGYKEPDLGHERVPNPFGGGQHPPLEVDAYIVGIVPH